jgi:hypothetical protein
MNERASIVIDLIDSIKFIIINSNILLFLKTKGPYSIFKDFHDFRELWMKISQMNGLTDFERSIMCKLIDIIRIPRNFSELRPSIKFMQLHLQSIENEYINHPDTDRCNAVISTFNILGDGITVYYPDKKIDIVDDHKYDMTHHGYITYAGDNDVTIYADDNEVDYTDFVMQEVGKWKCFSLQTNTWIDLKIDSRIILDHIYFAQQTSQPCENLKDYCENLFKSKQITQKIICMDYIANEFSKVKLYGNNNSIQFNYYHKLNICLESINFENTFYVSPRIIEIVRN